MTTLNAIPAAESRLLDAVASLTAALDAVGTHDMNAAMARLHDAAAGAKQRLADVKASLTLCVADVVADIDGIVADISGGGITNIAADISDTPTPCQDCRETIPTPADHCGCASAMSAPDAVTVAACSPVPPRDAIVASLGTNAQDAAGAPICPADPTPAPTADRVPTGRQAKRRGKRPPK